MTLASQPHHQQPRPRPRWRARIWSRPDRRLHTGTLTKKRPDPNRLVPRVPALRSRGERNFRCDAIRKRHVGGAAWAREVPRLRTGLARPATPNVRRRGPMAARRRRGRRCARLGHRRGLLLSPAAVVAGVIRGVAARNRRGRGGARREDASEVRRGDGTEHPDPDDDGYGRDDGEMTPQHGQQPTHPSATSRGSFLGSAIGHRQRRLYAPGWGAPSDSTQTSIRHGRLVAYVRPDQRSRATVAA